MSDEGRVWACDRGHEVREGMFHCVVCGSDDVALRDPGAVPAAEPAAAPDRGSVRVAALDRLRSLLVTGAVLVGVGMALIGLAALGVDPGGGGQEPGAALLLLGVLGDVVGLVGAALVLVGLIGHGVRLGTEASQADRPPTP